MFSGGVERRKRRDEVAEKLRVPTATSSRIWKWMWLQSGVCVEKTDASQSAFMSSKIA